MKLKVMPTALTFGLFLGLVHAVWMFLVYLGVAQNLMAWVFGIHLLSIPVKVLPFNFSTAITLVVFTFVVGYLMGWVFASVWNKVHKGK